MAETTIRLGLPLIQVGQAQKEVTHNEALHRIDTFLHLMVESRSVGVPPPAPAAGSVWIVAAGASGAWAGSEGRLAEWDGAGWQICNSQDGMLCVIADEGIVAVHAGGAWRGDHLPVGGLTIGGANMLGAPRTSIAEPVGGPIIDAEARAAIGTLLAYLRLQGIVAD